MTQPLDTPKIAQKNVENTHKPHLKDKEKFKRIFKEIDKDKPKQDSYKQEEEPTAPMPLHLLFSEKPVAETAAMECFSTHKVTEAEQVFEKMVGMMHVMDTSGVSETTFFLNSPEIETSLFYGAKIVITEYSTAPKAFNVQIVASSEALVLFQRKAPQLMSLFEEKDYNFKIHRLDTSELPIGYDDDEENLDE